MSIHLDPLIQQKLSAFAGRRRRLIVIRGAFAGVAMLLLTLLIIAVVDYTWVLPDWVRWTLSGGSYLAVIVVAWRHCLSQLVHAPDARQLARLVDNADPKLGEVPISAGE